METEGIVTLKRINLKIYYEVVSNKWQRSGEGSSQTVSVQITLISVT